MTNKINKKVIKTLAYATYKNDKVDEKIADRIARLLTKCDLKNYIRELKMEERKRNLFASVPFFFEEIEIFGKTFPDKNIIYEVDASLLLGVKLIDNDMQYEFNLRNSLSKIVSYIQNTYD